MLVVPVPVAVTTPLFTVATSSSPLVQVRFLLVAFPGVMVAIRVSVPPTARERAFLFRLTPVTLYTTEPSPVGSPSRVPPLSTVIVLPFVSREAPSEMVKLSPSPMVKSSCKVTLPYTAPALLSERSRPKTIPTLSSAGETFLRSCSNPAPIPPPLASTMALLLMVKAVVLGTVPLPLESYRIPGDPLAVRLPPSTVRAAVELLLDCTLTP